ncbi:MAG: murein biosynthesis integral membrane protein MurJ [Helicobacteraceae bacterium]|nr:murein biosynthesis integral membrane protein MurJ [Helicobacteraceae bacterium]
MKGIFTNSTGILVSRVAGFARDFTTASILGANIYSDIFFVAIKIPNLFRSVFADGAFTQAFLPSFVAAKYKGAFSVNVFLRIFCAVLILSLLATIFSEYLTAAIALGFDEATIKTAAPFVAVNFWYLDFVFLISFLAALLHYRNSFAAPAFSTALLNVSMIIALIIARGENEKTIVWFLSFGVLIGGALQLLLHIAALKGKRLGAMLLGGFKKKRDSKADTDRFYKAFFPAVFGASTAYVSAFLDTLLATFLAVGSVSYLYYANRIFQLPLALFAIAVSMALFPAIAKAIKRGDMGESKRLLSKNFWLLAFLLSLSALGGALLSDGIIWLLFERGKFARADTSAAANILAIYMIGLTPFGLARLFSLWLYSTARQGLAAKNSAIALGFNILFSLAFIKPLGVSGLALAGALTGVILLFLSAKALGWQTVLGMIRAKLVFALAIAVALEALAIEGFKLAVNYRGFFG